MASWSQGRAEAVREQYPWVPDRVIAMMEFDQRQMNTAIGVMTLLMAAAAADGHRTGGRSAFFQTMLAGFGLHTFTHLAQSVAERGYTPGVITAPTVVGPFSYWAWRKLDRAGVLHKTTPANTVLTAVAMPAVMAGVHVTAYGINRLVDRARGRRR